MVILLLLTASSVMCIVLCIYRSMRRVSNYVSVSSNNNPGLMYRDASELRQARLCHQRTMEIEVKALNLRKHSERQNKN